MTVPYYHYYYLGGIFSSCYATLLNISLFIIYDYYLLLLKFNSLSMSPLDGLQACEGIMERVCDIQVMV